MPEKQMTAKELGAALWACADKMRGPMDANDYKDYLLGLVFYKALSDRQLYEVVDQLENRKPDSLDEAQTIYEEAAADPVDAPLLQKRLEQQFGAAIPASRTFNAFCAAIRDMNFHLTDLKDAFNHIEAAKGHFYAGLFEGFNIQSERLGDTDQVKADRIADCMTRMARQDFGAYSNDILGDAYEYLIAQFAEGSGKKAGEFYTPQKVSEILARVVTHGKEQAEEDYTVYDPCCGSASLLLQPLNFIQTSAKRHIYFYGQEINRNTYRLARMNCILHQVPSQYQYLRCGDTLDADWPSEEPTNFQGVLMNPPYSQEWKVSEDRLIDQRFSHYERLAPKSYADYAFLLHGYYHLAPGGKMGIVLPHGVLSRVHAEKVIRKHLIEDGAIEAVVGLAPKLFFSTGIEVCLIFLRKEDSDRNILFVDASKEFTKGTPQNLLSDENVNRIVETVLARKDVDRFAHLASYEEIVENDYNLSIRRYVDSSVPEPDVDIDGVIGEYRMVSEKEAATVKTLKGYFNELGIKFPGV